MRDVVFDSHAVLKFAQDEAGANLVEVRAYEAK